MDIVGEQYLGNEGLCNERPAMEIFMPMDPRQDHSDGCCDFSDHGFAPWETGGAVGQAARFSVVFCHSVLLNLSLCHQSMEQLHAKPFWCPRNEKANSPVPGKFEGNKTGWETEVRLY